MQRSGETQSHRFPVYIGYYKNKPFPMILTRGVGVTKLQQKGFRSALSKTLSGYRAEPAIVRNLECGAAGHRGCPAVLGILLTPPSLVFSECFHSLRTVSTISVLQAIYFQE